MAKSAKYATEVSSDFVKFGTDAESKVWHEAHEGETAIFTESLEGTLVSMDSIVMDGKPVGKYKIEREDGSTVAFLGSVLLDDKLSMIEIGTDISVQLTGAKKSQTAGHSPTKQFSVFKAE